MQPLLYSQMVKLFITVFSYFRYTYLLQTLVVCGATYPAPPVFSHSATFYNHVSLFQVYISPTDSVSVWGLLPSPACVLKLCDI